MIFEWDERKNQSNIRKHGVSFEDAQKIFDLPALNYFDANNSLHEDRYVEIGFCGGRLLTVVFVELGCDRIRIISARTASLSEETRYERGY
ncbi:BrnT family toxin [Duganella aceris]|uniref:BrnT family toxin n=1 Tax=Duganella aceris TaxID=2703883 RepID=A0ABX0FTM3_9BURK|nr:BrnT family toxin [Duganella aceris]NGZ87890.1 BrnT family toxin [Duganella aceris]